MQDLQMSSVVFYGSKLLKAAVFRLKHEYQRREIIMAINSTLLKKDKNMYVHSMQCIVILSQMIDL